MMFYPKKDRKSCCLLDPCGWKTNHERIDEKPMNSQLSSSLGLGFLPKITYKFHPESNLTCSSIDTFSALVDV